MKKTLSMLLAFSMLLGLLTTMAFAAGETYTITINNKVDGHTYEAYQIFTGDLSGDAKNDATAGTSAVLSNVKWGASVTNASELGSATDYAKALANTSKSIEAMITEIELGSAFKTSTYKGDTYVVEGLTAGYYLIKDLDNSLSGENDAYTEYIVEVVENSTLAPKSDVPTVQKKVDDKNDSNTTEDAVVWQDSADHDIGDSVPFQLKATLANNVSAYATYKIVFHDTLSAGLTYDENAIVKVGNTVVYNAKDATQNKTGVSVTYSGTSLTVTIEDVKADGIQAGNGAEVIVEYTATLNNSAVIGAAGNPNEVYLEFSNNPNWNGEGTEETGKTPTDKVIVFTYKTVINKVDEKGEALAGAEFTLYKKNAQGKYEVVGTKQVGTAAADSEIANIFTWEGLDDGDYMLEETTTPAGYNTIAPIEFTISATHDETADDPKLLTLTGGDKFTGEVDANKKPTGTLISNVVNNKGSVLPETGGIGTTIFYVLGGLMAVGAGVLLVAKKRMDA